MAVMRLPTVQCLCRHADPLALPPLIYLHLYFTLRVCTKSWSSSYDELLSRTSLPSLQERRQQFKLCHTFNIINNFAFFPEAPLRNRSLSYSSRTVHNQSLIPIHAHSSQFKFSFFPSVIDHWNSLPERVTSSSSVMLRNT